MGTNRTRQLRRICFPTALRGSASKPDLNFKTCAPLKMNKSILDTIGSGPQFWALQNGSNPWAFTWALQNGSNPWAFTWALQNGSNPWAFTWALQNGSNPWAFTWALENGSNPAALHQKRIAIRNRLSVTLVDLATWNFKCVQEGLPIPHAGGLQSSILTYMPSGQGRKSASLFLVG